MGELTEQDLEKLKAARSELRRDRAFFENGLRHKTTNLLLRGALAYAAFHGFCKGDLSRNEFLSFFNREGRTGLLVDSIFQSSLYTPGEGRTLSLIAADAGRYVSYDFRRTSVFKNPYDIVTKGKLASFPIDEISTLKKEEYAPPFELFNIYHLAAFEFSTIDRLADQELVEHTTYQDAYKKAGLYDRYATHLHIAGIAELPAYRVTPKGNGLIFLMKDSGSRKRQKDQSNRLVHAPV